MLVSLFMIKLTTAESSVSHGLAGVPASAGASIAVDGGMLGAGEGACGCDGTRVQAARSDEAQTAKLMER